MTIAPMAADKVEALHILHGWRKKSAEPTGFDDCSLVVPTYRRPTILVALLSHLAGLTDLPAEVVVVDGSPGGESGEAVAAWARGRDLPFDLVYVKSPPGLTRQRNVGVDASTGQFVFFLDDDCVPQAGYFRAIRDVFVGDARGEIGAVCGSIINEMDKPLPLRWRMRFLLGLLPRNGESGRYYPTVASLPRSMVSPFSGSRRVDIMPGCSMAFRRFVLDGHRFSRFFQGYSQGEDLEMSLRIGKEWTILWCGDAHVVHDHAHGGRPNAFEKGKMEVRNRFFIWKRYSPSARIADRLKFWADIAFVVAYDVASFVARPTQTWNLSHARGVVSGACGCCFAPPRCEEPVARREYELCLRDPAHD